MKGIQSDIRNWLATHGRAKTIGRLRKEYKLDFNQANVAVAEFIRNNPAAIIKAKTLAEKTNGFAALVILFLFFWGGCKLCSSDGNSEPETEITFLQDSTEFKFTAYTIACETLKGKLKAPATADFPSEGATLHTTMTADSMALIKSYVDAQNSFGANLRTNFVGAIKYKGGDPDSFKNWEIFVELLDQ